MLKYEMTKTIELQDWDKYVRDEYGKIYSFQQQNGCRSRGQFYFTVPDEPQDFKNDSIPEEVNGEVEGVSFEAWKARDPNFLGSFTRDFENELFWQRNFYPDIQMIANDLHEKGKLEAGEYMIIIDW